MHVVRRKSTFSVIVTCYNRSFFLHLEAYLCVHLHDVIEHVVDLGHVVDLLQTNGVDSQTSFVP